MRSEIGFTVWVLSKKRWGKTFIDGKIRSQRWWQQRLEYLINKEEDPIPSENLWDGKPVDYPIPFEVEVGMPDLNHDTFLTAWKKMKSKQHA